MEHSQLLFEYADIATFSPEEKIQYELDMTTEADRINQLNYAREKGREEGAEIKARETAKTLLSLGVSEDIIVKSTGLSPCSPELTFCTIRYSFGPSLLS